MTCDKDVTRYRRTRSCDCSSVFMTTVKKQCCRIVADLLLTK